jgi:hypothetical protein
VAYARIMTKNKWGDFRGKINSFKKHMVVLKTKEDYETICIQTITNKMN